MASANVNVVVIDDNLCCLVLHGIYFESSTFLGLPPPTTIIFFNYGHGVISAQQSCSSSITIA